MNENILFIFGQMQAAITRREAMIAENQARIAQGMALAYDGDAFYEIADELENLARAIYG